MDRTISNARDIAVRLEVLSEIPGGADLLGWFGGHPPSFHDVALEPGALTGSRTR